MSPKLSTQNLTWGSNVCWLGLRPLLCGRSSSRALGPWLWFGYHSVSARASWKGQCAVFCPFVLYAFYAPGKPVKIPIIFCSWAFCLSPKYFLHLSSPMQSSFYLPRNPIPCRQGLILLQDPFPIHSLPPMQNPSLWLFNAMCTNVGGGGWRAV